MIEKIIKIQNIGRFKDFKLKATLNWNGEFTHANIIYASNGYGKTTLANIFKSLKYNDPKFIELKKTFSTTENQEILLKELQKSELIQYKDGLWNRPLNSIDIFDIHFIEDFLFIGSITQKKTKENLFALMLGNRGLQYRGKGRKLIRNKIDISNREKKKGKATSEIVNSNEYKKNTSELIELLESYNAYSQPIFEKQILTTNKYLSRFAPYIKLKKFTDNRVPNTTGEYEIFRPYISLTVHEHNVDFQAPDYSQKKGNVKYTLSEGDKSAFALCFFLAILENNDISNRIILIDDPLSSFDYGRRTTTISHIANIAGKCRQLIVLTHDIYFAKELSQKLYGLKIRNLKIENNGVTSYLTEHDIVSETHNSLQKDFLLIKKYFNYGAETEFDKREVIRCIRPILEGIIKTKYFEFFSESDWLGDIISKIRNADANSQLYRLNDIIFELTDLNDFSKSFHHGNIEGGNHLIDSQELKSYIEVLMKIIYRI